MRPARALALGTGLLVLASLAGCGMATILADGSGLGPATGARWQFGTHPRLQPTVRTIP